MFEYLGCSVFDSHEIASLLKNFAHESPLQPQEIPQWSLPLVLSSLKGASL